MRLKFIPFILVAFLFACSNAKINRLVEIQNGKIEGEINESGVLAFKGIPFAKPPVDDLRWKAPQALEKWDGILDCKKFGASAMQATPLPFRMWTSEFMAPVEPLSEDCLYLNVWTSAQTKEDKLPVIVFIHGGGFTSGSGSVPIYDGEEMAKKGVVFVTINYRVGIFGFFAHPELTAEAPYGSSGNYGLLDQIAGLQWVNENITAFGGDPENVTIAGQSAGAFSMNYLVASPLTKGLIHRVIAESGAAIFPTNGLAAGNTLQTAEQSGIDLLKRLNMSSIEDLRAMSANELLQVRTASQPIIDGYVLPTDMYSIFSNGQQNDIPILMGWNSNEGFGGPPVDAATFIANTQTQYGDKAVNFLKAFPANTEEEAKITQEELNGIQMFGIQAYEWMELQNQTGSSQVFMYHFTREVPHGEGQQSYGAFHTGEVPYAYNNLKMSDDRPWDEVDYKLADIMSSYWVNFAKNGDPNAEGLPNWLPCEADEYYTMFLGDTQELKQIPYAEGLKLLSETYKSQLK